MGLGGGTIRSWWKNQLKFQNNVVWFLKNDFCVAQSAAYDYSNTPILWRDTWTQTMVRRSRGLKERALDICFLVLFWDSPWVNTCWKSWGIKNDFFHKTCPHHSWGKFSQRNNCSKRAEWRICFARCCSNRCCSTCANSLFSPEFNDGNFLP